MTFPKGPPQRYIPSRQLVDGTSMNNFNDQSFSAQPLTATGVAQGDAAAIDAANVEVLAGSANNAGVRLPISYPGATIEVLNNSANTTIIYATGSDQIQNAATTYLAANAGYSMATLTSWEFKCIKKGFWQKSSFAGT